MTMKTPYRVPLVAGVATLLLLGGAWVPLSAQQRVRDTTVEMTRTSVVDVTLSSGNVIIRGISGTTGSVRGLRSDQRVRSTGVALTVAGRADDDDDRSSRTRSRARNRDALEIDVPRGVRVVVNTRSGDVEVQDFTGELEVYSQSGTQRLHEVRGRVIAESLSGDVTITGAPTSVRLTTVSGDIAIRGARGEVEVHTTSGDIRIDEALLSRLMVEAMSADVDFDGSFTEDARVQLSTHSGDIVLRLPDTLHGRIDVSTVSGKLTAGFPMTLAPGNFTSTGRGRSARRYQMGNGGPLQFDITTFNGDVRILRGNRS